MRAQTALFTSLLRALFVSVFLLLVLLDASRNVWIDLAGLSFTGALLLAVIVLGLRTHPRLRERSHDDERPADTPTTSPTPPQPPR
jgi:hypothetical protein